MARMKNGRIKAPPKRRNIEMVIISAQDLKDVRKLGKMRTFATVYCPTSQKVSTRVDSEGGTSPTWNEKIVLSIEESYLREESAQLTIDLYCRGTIRDKLVGTVRLFLANALKPGRGLNKFPATSHLVFRPTGDPQGILNICIPPGGKFPDKIDLSFKDSESEMVDDIPPFQAPVEAGSSSGFEEDEDLAMEEDHFTPEKSPSSEKSPVSFHDLSPEKKSPVSDPRLSPQRSPVDFHDLSPGKKSPVSDHRFSPQRSPVSAHDLSPEKKSPVSDHRLSPQGSPVSAQDLSPEKKSHSPSPSRSDDEYLSLDDDHEQKSPARSQKKSPFRTPAGSPAKENDQNSPSKNPSELKNSPVKHFSPHREDAAIQKSPFRTPTGSPAKGNQDQIGLTSSPLRNVAAAKEEKDLVQKSGSPDRKDDAVVEEMGIYKSPSPNRRNFTPHSSPDLTKKDERFKGSPPKGLSDSCARKEDQLQSFESAARNQDQKLDIEDRNHYQIEGDHPPEKNEDQRLVFQNQNQDHLGNNHPAQKNEDQRPIHADQNQDRLPENHLVEKNEDQKVIQLQKDHPVEEKEDQKQILFEDFKFPVSRRSGREDLSKNVDPDVEKDRIEEQKIHEIQRSPMRSPPNPKSVRRNRGHHYPNYFA